MYRVDIAPRHDGGINVTCGEHSHHDERGLARKLVNAGAADGPIEAAGWGARITA